MTLATVQGFTGVDAPIVETLITGPGAEPNNVTNLIGGDLRIQGGWGVHKWTVLDFSLFGSEVLRHNFDGLTVVLTEGTHFDAITDNATTAANLAVALNANGSFSARYFAWSVAADVFIKPDSRVPVRGGIIMHSTELTGIVAALGRMGSISLPGRGYSSVAIGGADGPAVAGNGASVVIGSNAKDPTNTAFGGDGSVVIGDRATTDSDATGIGSRGMVIIGSTAGIEGGNGFGVVIGSGASSAGGSCVLVGNGATTASNGCALGHSADSGGQALAVGNLSSALSGLSTAVGHSATASAGSTVAVGASSNVSGTFSVAVGRGAGADTTGVVAIGYLQNILTGSNIVAVGAAGGVEIIGGAGDVAIGYRVHTGTGSQNVAVGREARILSATGVAIGYRATTGGNTSISIGGLSTTGEGSANVVVGNNSIHQRTTTITVVNYLVGAGDTLTFNQINGVALVRTEGVNFTAATSNDDTAESIRVDLDGISGITATRVGSVVTVYNSDAAHYVLSVVSSDPSFATMSLAASSSNTILGAGILVRDSTNSVVVGQGSSITKSSINLPNNCVVIGHSATSDNRDNVVIGQGASAAGSGGDSTVIGYLASALSGNSTVLGRTAGNSAFAGTMIGQSTSVTGNNGTVCGAASTAGQSATALGITCVASGPGSVAVGQSSNALGNGGIAIGNNADSILGNAVAIGKNSYCAQSESLAIGPGNSTEQGAQCRGVASISIGSLSGSGIGADCTTVGAFATAVRTVTITVVDYTLGALDTLTISSIHSDLVATEGTNFTAATSNDDTAESIRAYYDANPNLSATRVGAVVSVAHGPANRYPLSVLSSDTGFATMALRAAGNNTTIVGRGATAQDSDNSVLIGQGSSITVSGSGDENNDNVIIGQSASSDMPDAGRDGRNTLVGYNTSTTNGNNVVMGWGATANRDATVVGYNASHTGFGGVVVGRSAVGTGGISVGDSASTVNSGGIAIGNSSSSLGTLNVTIGHNASGDTQCVVIGSSATSAGKPGCVAIGDLSTANATNTIAIGRAAFADGGSAVSSIALGFRARAGGSSALAVGHDTYSTGRGVAIGGLNSTFLVATSSGRGVDNIAIGSGSQVTQISTVTVNNNGTITTLVDTITLTRPRVSGDPVVGTADVEWAIGADFNETAANIAAWINSLAHLNAYSINNQVTILGDLSALSELVTGATVALGTPATEAVTLGASSKVTSVGCIAIGYAADARDASIAIGHEATTGIAGNMTVVGDGAFQVRPLLLTVVDYTLGAGDTISLVGLDGIKITGTEGVDFTASTSNDVTAENIRVWLDGLTGFSATRSTDKVTLLNNTGPKYITEAFSSDTGFLTEAFANLVGDCVLIGQGVSSRGFQNTIIGQNAKVTGQPVGSTTGLTAQNLNDNIVIGRDAEFNGWNNVNSNSTVIGHSARANECVGGVVIIGSGAEVSGNGQSSCIVIGSLADATIGSSVILIGTLATNSGGGSGVAIGHTASVLGAGVALGNAASAASGSAVCIGNNATGTGISIGVSTTSGNIGVAVGNSADASNNAVAIGGSAQALAGGATAIGFGANAPIGNSNAFGAKADCQVSNGLAIGGHTSAWNAAKVMLGAANGISIGVETTTGQGDNNTVIGTNSTPIRTLIITILDYTRGALDTLTIARPVSVASGDIVATEGTDFAAVTSNDVTAENIRAYIDGLSNMTATANANSVIVTHATSAYYMTSVVSSDPAFATMLLDTPDPFLTILGEGIITTGTHATSIGQGSSVIANNGTALGQGALAAAGVAIGRDASQDGGQDVAIGNSATVNGGGGGVAVGISASVSNANGVALGNLSVASGNSSTALGQGTTVTHSFAVAIGAFAESAGGNSLVIGSVASPMSVGYIGQGAIRSTTGALGAFTLGATDRTTVTDESGMDLTVRAGKGTGSAPGTEMILETSTPTTTGTTQQVSAERLKLAHNVIGFQTNPMSAPWASVAVDLTTVATTTLFTVPAGKTFIYDKILLHTTAATGAAGDTIGDINVNAGASAIVTSGTIPVGAVDDGLQMAPPLSTVFHVAVGGDTIDFTVGTADTTASVLGVTAHLFGVLF